MSNDVLPSPRLPNTGHFPVQPNWNPVHVNWLVLLKLRLCSSQPSEEFPVQAGHCVPLGEAMRDPVQLGSYVVSDWEEKKGTTYQSAIPERPVLRQEDFSLLAPRLRRPDEKDLLAAEKRRTARQRDKHGTDLFCPNDPPPGDRRLPRPHPTKAARRGANRSRGGNAQGQVDEPTARRRSG
jgi:hypothetical protein